MGKTTGFLEFKRRDLKSRKPDRRIKDWNEFHSYLGEEILQEQGARCMGCGIPFCHTGMTINRMTSGCPINNLIPEWNDLVYKGEWKLALGKLSQTNNFPEFTGRVCPAPCEGSCTLGINNPPVTIKNIELAIVEKGFNEGWISPTPPETRTEKNVAIVGSGPAGLACADQLNKVGHNVTVFERSDRPGGLLMYGIPNMKLPKVDIVERRINLLEEEGINFILNTEVGKNYPLKKLRSEFDAVVLCGGATKPGNLSIEGRSLEGIYFAMDFLKANTKSLLDSQLEDEKYISAKGKNVVVIGGGDTGTDCVGTSIRHGCKSIVQLEIMDKPPVQRANDNPWPEWPKVYFLDYGQEEAKSIFGNDPRNYSVITNNFSGDKHGQVQKLHTSKVTWSIGENGAPVPTPVPDTSKIIKADLVLLALGYSGPETNMLKSLKIEQDKYSNVKADYNNFQTNVEGIFTAGDMRRGQSLVVWAINEGRGAAREIDKYLSGETYFQ